MNVLGMFGLGNTMPKSYNGVIISLTKGTDKVFVAGGDGRPQWWMNKGYSQSGPGIKADYGSVEYNKYAVLSNFFPANTATIAPVKAPVVRPPVVATPTITKPNTSFDEVKVIASTPIATASVIPGINTLTKQQKIIGGVVVIGGLLWTLANTSQGKKVAKTLGIKGIVDTVDGAVIEPVEGVIDGAGKTVKKAAKSVGLGASKRRTKSRKGTKSINVKL